MTTWVLLRGLTRESRHWGTFPDVLATHLPGARIVAIDLPGNGTLNALRSPLRAEAMAAHCRAELGARSLPPPYALLAMSLGAMVATAMAVHLPHEVERMVLVNTSMRPFSRFDERLRPNNCARLLRLALLPHADRAAEELVLAMTSERSAKAPPCGSAEVLARWVAIRRSAPVSRANALRQLIAATRFTAPRAAPIAKVLVLTSAHDALVSTRCSQQLAHAWRCPVASHPTAGHDLPLDDAPWVARQVQAWLGVTGQGVKGPGEKGPGVTDQGVTGQGVAGGQAG